MNDLVHEKLAVGVGV